LAAGLGSPQVEGYGTANVRGGGIVCWRSESKANQFKPFHLKAGDFDLRRRCKYGKQDVPGEDVVFSVYILKVGHL